MRWTALRAVAFLTVLFFGVALAKADDCPADCPPPADPTGLGCSYALRNCTGALGNPVVLTSVRTGVNQIVLATCDSCNEKNKGSVNAGIGVTTVDTSWSVNVPYGIGTVNGGSTSTAINLGGTLNCVDCASITAPYTVFDVTVTMKIPFVLTSITGFLDYACWWPFSYTLVTTNCGNYYVTTTYHTLEGALGASTNNTCPPNNSPPCGNG